MSASHRWGLGVARHRRLVITLWILAAVLGAYGFQLLGARLGAPDYGVPGSESSRVATLTQRDFHGLGSEQDLIVFKASHGSIADAANRKRIGNVLNAARSVKGVVSVGSPYNPFTGGRISRDGTAAFAVAALDNGDRPTAETATKLQQRVQATAQGLGAWLTGYSPLTNALTAVEDADSTRAESIGIPVALALLLLALGSVVAASLPILVALFALLVTFGALWLVSFAISADAFLIAITTMIGLGVGIDYSLFIVSRFREELARRDDGAGTDRAFIDHAVSTALTTSGRTVLFSGTIVALAICSLFLIDSPIFREISVGVLVVVVCTLAAAWTLLPAVLAALGPKVNRLALPARLRPTAGGTIDAERSFWGRWARAVMTRPVLAGGAVLVLLLLCASPLRSLRYGIDVGTASLADQPAGAGAKVLERDFSPGLIAPTYLVATGAGGAPLSGSGLRRAERLVQSLSSDRRVAAVVPTVRNDRLLAEVVLSVPVDSPAATRFVEHLRQGPAARLQHDTGIQLLVGGATAQFVDVSHATETAIPYILAIVLAFSAIVLLFVFKSVLLPLKAVAMNLLATAASVGITVSVFQWGYLSHALGFHSVGYLQVYIPITIFVILFGLSMDYEVFLIRRMHEAWLATRDNDDAVVVGIAHTARPIMAAAAIMVAVFGSYVTANVLELKQFGLGLAAAIALDATLVRLVLVPAFMRLLGAWNWWLPWSRSDGPARAIADGLAATGDPAASQGSRRP